MKCIFEEETTLPDGSFLKSSCINRAEILVVNDPCYGLCYTCAYKKIKAENKQYKNALQGIAASWCPQIYTPTCPEIAKQALKDNENET